MTKEKDLKKGKKNISHGLRYLAFAIQVASQGRITDFTVGNDLYAAIMGDPSSDWAYYERIYKPMYASKQTELARLLAPQLAMPASRLAPLLTLDYLREFGVASLAREFSVYLRRHATHPNLVLLLSDSLNSPLEHPIAQECNGLLLDDSDGGFRVVSYSLPLFFSWDQPNAVTLPDWQRVALSEKIDGSLAVLYPHGGRWQVASAESADASESALTKIEKGDLFFLARRPCYNPWKAPHTQLDSAVLRFADLCPLSFSMTSRTTKIACACPWSCSDLRSKRL